MAITRTDDLPDGLPLDEHRDRSLEAFFEEHYRRLVGLAGLVCGDVASAEDIVQTALERAWRSRDRLQDAARLRPWLDRIVVREAARERRSRLAWLSRRLRPTSDGMKATSLPEIEDPATAPAADWLALRSAFEALSAPQRAVVVLHLHAGYTIDETAAALGVPRETVRSRLRVARDQLRHALGEGD
jgi:RNA polymerase sigma-70 factor, ECF subfamily